MKVITLCGSTRFRAEFEKAQRDLALLGNVVISVSFFVHQTEEAVTPDEKILLDSIHCNKIALSDEILVINPGGYIGESTRNEINFAIKLGKKINYTS